MLVRCPIVTIKMSIPFPPTPSAASFMKDTKKEPDMQFDPSTIELMREFKQNEELNRLNTEKNKDPRQSPKLPVSYTVMPSLADQAARRGADEHLMNYEALIALIASQIKADSYRIGIAAAHTN